MNGYYLRRIGNPILREKCIDVTDYSALDDLLSAMRTEMSEHNGVGIAAPQVGDNRRVIAIIDHTRRKNFVNPVILEADHPILSFERCLSLPLLRLPKRRYYYLKLGYYDSHGNCYEEMFDGIPAIAVQHEIDHLNGRLITNYI